MGRIAFPLLLVVVLCNLLAPLRSSRIKQGIVHEVRATRSSEDADGPDQQLLACVVGEARQKILIKQKDEPFWIYYYTKEELYYFWRDAKAQSIKCKPYTPRSSVLAHLTTHPLPEEMLGIIASFDDSTLDCGPCHLVTFNPKFLDKCSTPGTEVLTEGQREEFKKTQDKLRKEGGSCKVLQNSYAQSGQTLQSCMRLGQRYGGNKEVGHYAACLIQSERTTQRIAQEMEDPLLADAHDQDTVHIKHIFEGL